MFYTMITSKQLQKVAIAITVFFARFLSVFSLDVFNEHLGWLQTLGALVIHLIPVWILLLLAWASYRFPWVGAVAFTALAVAYILISEFRFNIQTYLLISGPLFLLGLLYGLILLRKKKSE